MNKDGSHVKFSKLKASIIYNEAVSRRVTEICTTLADVIRWHLDRKEMTKKEFSKRTGISKWRLKRIFDGNYGGATLMDIYRVESEIQGENDKATRQVLVEKYKPQL